MNGATTTSGLYSTETTTRLSDQCDYSVLFSHLPLSFQFINAQINNLQLPGTNKQQQQYYSSSSSSYRHQHPNLHNYHQHQNLQNDLQLQYQQQSTYKLCFAFICLLFGLFYSIVGYRFIKISTFMIGFSLGSSIIYLILVEQKQLTLIENLIISLSIGVLFAFVALLVQYIGLFLLGITSSTAIVTCILIVIDLFYTNKSAWLCIGLLFLCATLVASFTLKFQKSFTILNTSAIGCGLLLIAVDFFVENNLLIDYIYELYKVNGNSFNMYDRQKALLKSSNDFIATTTSSTTTRLTTTTTTTTTATTSSTTTQLYTSSLINSLLTTMSSVTTSSSSSGTLFTNRKMIVNSTSNTATSNQANSALALFLHLYSSAHARLCWYTWLIFGSYFILLFISLLIQFLLTGRNYDHRDSWQKLIRGSRKKKSANLEKIRLKSHLNSASNHGDDHHSYHHHHQHDNQNEFLNNESTMSRSSDIELVTSHNDTLLLVESGRNETTNLNSNSLAYTVDTTIDHIPIASSNRANSSNNKRRKGGNHNHDDNLENLEIVSFEIIKPSKKEKQKSSKKQSSSTTTPNHHQQVSSKKQSSSKEANHNSVSTTTSTSSTSSSSSTCQLIPMKLTAATAAAAASLAQQNDFSTSSTFVTGTSSSSSSSANAVKPPPLPTSVPPSAPPASLIVLNQQPITPSAPLLPNPQSPPPVPTLPPPKLPQSLMGTVGSQSISSTNLLTNNSLVNPLNISKIKHHRSSNAKDKDKDKDKDVVDKFRYFYQIRRNNGDVLSQDFMNNLQTKLSNNNLNTNNSNSTQESAGSSNSHPRSSSLNSTDKKKSNKSSKQNQNKK